MLGAAAAVRLTVAAVAAALLLAPRAAAGPVNASAVSRPQYDDTCMMCVCRANGRKGECVTDEKCTHADTYGPFCISWPYWTDAGKPVLPGDDKDLPGAFRRCVEEPFCAVQTVRGYMETGPALQDCDQDGTITCRDLMLTHLHGRYNCQDKKDARVDLLMRCLNTTSKPTTTPPTTTLRPERLPARPGSGPARPGSAPARPGSVPARPGSAPARPGSAPARPGGSPYTDRTEPHNNHHLTDSIHFPGDDVNTGHGGSVGGIPNGASRTAFNSLHVGPQPDGFGETEDNFPNGMTNPLDPSREILNAINTHMREMGNVMNNNMQGMGHTINTHMQGMGNVMNNHMQGMGNTMRQNFNRLNIQHMGGNIPGNPHPHPNEDVFSSFHGHI